MKTTTKKITATAAAIAAMMTMGSACMAYDAGSSNISITNGITNSIVGGDMNIVNSTTAVGGTVNNQIANIVNGVIVGGNANIADISALAGRNVVSTDTTAVSNAVI